MRPVVLALCLTAALLPGACVYHHETVREHPSGKPRDERMADGAAPAARQQAALLDAGKARATGSATLRTAETGIHPERIVLTTDQRTP